MTISIDSGKKTKMSTVHLTNNPEQARAEHKMVAPHPEYAGGKIELIEILRIILRQKKVILATTIVVIASAFVILENIIPVYTAKALVEINARQSRVVDFESVLTGLSADAETIATEISIIQSRKLAKRVIDRLDLFRDPEFNPALRPSSLLESWRYALADWLARNIETPQEVQADSDQATEQSTSMFNDLMRGTIEYIAPIANTEDVNADHIQFETERVIDEFLKNLNVNSDRRSRIVEISFESRNAKTAAAAANAIADFYIVAQLEAKFEATKRATEWLNERVAQLRNEVVEKERAIEEYRAKSGLLTGGTASTLASEQITELNTQYVQEMARLAEARARLRQASSLSNIESAVEVLESPLIRELRGQEATIVSEIADLAEEYGERHPTMINARAKLRDLQTKIKLEEEKIIEGLRNAVSVAEARTASLANSLEQHKQELAKLNQSQVDLRTLELDANASRTLLENLLERTKQTTSQESFQQADADIVSSAVIPRKPSFPQKSLFLAISCIFGVTVGVLLAFIIEHLDFGIRSGEEISRILGVRSLGLLPKVSKISIAGKALHEYLLDKPDSAFAEGIRALYTNLLLSDVLQRPKVIMITSAYPNEGKTTVTICLASLLATSGYRALVVDCDMRNPTVAKRLGIEPGPGLAECLASGALIGDVIQEDEASGVHVLQAGMSDTNNPEKLDSILMQKMLRQFGRQYDIVLLDSAPVLALADSLFLARLADKTVLLVRWAKTRRTTANAALHRLLTAQANVAGVLLTMVDVKSHASYGYGDSGLYHGKFRKYYTS